ncbi:MAG TPA: PDZ domain-containing protein [Steroidobacteraceae bacterium]|nr:PDZ domain-containing protein [Steroidobacteraceae bacterium]
MKKKLLALASLMITGICNAQSEPGPLLLQQPTMNRTQIVFVYGGELWSVSRDGGAASRLTTGVGIQSDPHFSPDGRWVAFTGNYGGNPDVYVVSANGGVPRRLTYHPAFDQAIGWTPDGTRVLFASNRDAFASGVTNLYSISLKGGLPERLPFPLAFEGAYSPDGTQIAYRPAPFAFGTWSHYRGGTETKIWLAKLSDSSYEEIPRGDWNEFDPMWLGGKLYFLSDEHGPFTLYEYDPSTKESRQVLPNEGMPIKEASAGPDAIIYSQFGSIHIFDPASGREHSVSVRVAGDFPQLLPHFDSVEHHILSADISPTGARAVFEAHGEILTVPAEHGDVRDITHSPGVADRTPAWSPDGKSIAYFSDESGEYALHVRGQKGLAPARKFGLGSAPTFFYDPRWSPDSKKIAYTDKRLNVWYLDLATGTPVKIDTDVYETPERTLSPSWSPDSEWVAYTKLLRNHMRAVFVYSLAAGKSTQITDGMSDARSAVWDKSGKWLYFTASTDVGPTTAWLDMSSYDHTVTRNIYVVVLSKDEPSPIEPQSDEEGKSDVSAETAEDSSAKAAAEDKDRGDRKGPKSAGPQTPKVRIDFGSIDQRILALPIPAKNYVGIQTGKAGELFLIDLPPEQEASDVPPAEFSPLAVEKFELKTRKTTPVISGVQGFLVSFNGEKALIVAHRQWSIASTAGPIKAGDGALKMQDMKVYVDPVAEWKQMYHEVWRIERDFFYAPNFHGLDLEKTEAEYAKYLPGLAGREDENYLFNQMLSDLNVGHMFVRGGEVPAVPPVSVGLLGADYRIENGRYRIVRVLSGENWNPRLHAPLTQPGVNVIAGDYLLAVDGRELRATDNVYSYFLDKANKQVVIRVGPSPDGRDARDVTVMTVREELNLRHRDWLVHNMQTVDRMSGGKLAYVYLPNTAGAGYDSFNRYYMAQVGKQGAVMDERFNGGGSVANYIIETMQRKLTSYWYTRQGAVFTSPLDAIFGPKVMVTNQFAGSGGDWLPWAFKSVGLGPTVGEKTWGGLVGIYDYPELIDGGTVTAPRVAFFNPNGTWDVENHGVPPDVPLVLDPKAWREGHDVQLEKAVSVAMDELARHPLPTPQVPPFPDYSRYAR